MLNFRDTLVTAIDRTRSFVTGHPYYCGAYFVLFLIASMMRFWDLGLRAVHHDESLHAYYSWNIFTGSGYVHNPMMHGPFQMEATAALFHILGDSDATSRILYAIAGSLLVLLPFLFRSRLGNWGALATSVMLAFSPALLYYSRFARNDILMAVWVLGLVIVMWKFLDGGDDENIRDAALGGESSGDRATETVARIPNETLGEKPEDSTKFNGEKTYIFIAAALLSLAFATKENSYLITATLGLYLTLIVFYQNLAIIRAYAGVAIGKDSPPVATLKLLGGVVKSLRDGMQGGRVSRPAGFLLLLITLTLPLWAAAVSIFQDTILLSWSNLTLASPVGAEHPIGAPTRGGVVIAFGLVAILTGLAIRFGLKWDKGIWWKSAIIFYSIFVVSYTTFFTNWVGIGSGIWQSLGYWVVQQGEARGDQPWYYYFVITALYEFLPLLLSVIASVYYLRKGDRFGVFLVYWVWVTFLLYTVASEKMPWLLVNLTLPMIVLSGKFIGDVLYIVQWRRMWASGAWLLLPGIPVLLLLVWNLSFTGLTGFNSNDITLAALFTILIVALVGVGYVLSIRFGRKNFAGLALVTVSCILLVVGIRASWIATYENHDIPVEMMVYTHTTPDLHRLANQLRSSEGGSALIAIDGASGFHWPWFWYLRDRQGINYTSFTTEGDQTVPEAPISLVHSGVKSAVDSTFTTKYGDAKRLRHRWWFPEVYRDITLMQLAQGMIDRQTWRSLADYFLHRRIQLRDGRICNPRTRLFECLGSEDAYIYQMPGGDQFEPRF